MDTFYWILQGIVSIVAMVAFLIILHQTLKEYGLFGMWLFFPPVLVIYCIVRWERFKTPIVVFVAGLALSAVFQRARLGYWAWPDVGREAQWVPESNEDALQLQYVGKPSFLTEGRSHC